MLFARRSWSVPAVRQLDHWFSPANLAATSPTTCNGTTGQRLCADDPNPTSGFFLMMPTEDVIELDMTGGRSPQIHYFDGGSFRASGASPAAPPCQPQNGKLFMRTHYCGQLNATLDGQIVTPCGWAHRRRDHGGVIFIDLSDREAWPR